MTEPPQILKLEQPDAVREAMRRLEDGVRAAERGLAPALEAYARNALLNLAVGRVLESEGPARTAAILLRLGTVILSGHRPDRGPGIALSRFDG